MGRREYGAAKTVTSVLLLIFADVTHTAIGTNKGGRIGFPTLLCVEELTLRIGELLL